MSTSRRSASPRIRAFVVAVAVLATVSACGVSDGPGDGPGGGGGATAVPDSTEVQVHFTDSSVPPQYHRSWTVTIDRAHVTVEVTSYGDVLHQATVPTPAALWSTFRRTGLPEGTAALADADPATARCPGGTMLELSIREAGEWDRHLRVPSPCGKGDGQANDRAEEQIRALVAPFTDLVHLDRWER